MAIRLDMGNSILAKRNAEAVQLTGASTTTKRRALDFYPTPPEATHALMQFLDLPEYFSVWEPACGDGSMSEVLKKYVANVLSTDLRDTGYGKGQIDFLEATTGPGNFKPDAIITNPPFAVSERFIRKALKHSSIVAMLLKSQYWHAAKRYPLFEANTPAYVLPLTWRPDFRNGELGGSPTMEVAWTVWIQGESECKYVPLRKP